MNIANMPVEITKVWDRGEVSIKIGDIPGAIISPKLTHIKVTYINTTDPENGRWEELIQTNIGNRVCKGCTRDPRLLEIAEKVLKGKFSSKDVGTIYPPLEQKVP